jgi:hypothetical protein
VVRALDLESTGQRHYGLKSHGIPGTYKLKRDAQAAIDACHDIEDKGAARPDTVGRYAADWTQIHPRAAITDRAYKYRIDAVLDVKLEGTPLRDWPLDRLRAGTRTNFSTSCCVSRAAPGRGP